MPKVPYKKRKDGRYYKQIVYGYDENGKRKVKTFYDKDWRELDKRVRNFQIELDNGTYTDNDITLGECVQLWWKTKEDLSPSTKYNYKGKLKTLDSIADIKLKDLKPRTISQVLEYDCKSEKGAKEATIYTLLKSILNFAVKRELVNKNVIDKIDKPKMKLSKRRALTPEEKNAVETVIESDKLRQRSKAVIAILYYTGMRRNEMLSLKKSDINWEENYIYVKRTLSMTENGKIYEKHCPKTTAGIRKIPIVPKLSNILKEYIEKLKAEEEYLFKTRYGTFITNGNFAVIWANIIKEINNCLGENEKIYITPHYLRHNYATELIYAGVPLKTVQYIMGHENINMTMNIYADVRLDMDDVISKLSKSMG
ncbi:MAG: site-specific integrase [bacterium]|nr:site-specific integrase [bacterium]